METLRIELLNPKAKKILNSLKELKLINIKKSEFSREKFLKILEEMRQDEPLSLEEIQKEVESVRSERAKSK